MKDGNTLSAVSSGDTHKRKLFPELLGVLERSGSIKALRERSLRIIAEVSGASRVCLSIDSGNSQYFGCWTDGSVDELNQAQSVVATLPARLAESIFVPDTNRETRLTSLASEFRKRKVRSGALVPLLLNSRRCGWLELHYCESYKRWSSIDRLELEQVAQYLAAKLSDARQVLRAVPSPSEEMARGLEVYKLRYQRLLEYGNILVIRTDSEFRVTEVIGDCKHLLGVEPEEFANAERPLWRRVVDKSDLVRLRQKLTRVMGAPREINEEFRIINQETGEVRWLLARGVPLFTDRKELIGWEGIGLDITERREAQEIVVSQSKRIEALYAVSKALQYNLDPSLVTLKGLRALVRATNSDSGLGLFYDGDRDNFELVAAEGVSASYIEEVEKRVNEESLVRYAVERGEGLRIDNIQNDDRAVVKLASKEGLKATIVMPLIAEGKVLGALVIFRKRAKKYSELDFELVSAAANQIALATHQAELYSSQKRQASSFAALYRLSHELSRHLTPKEVSQHAFTVLHEELACKRMWLGVVNEQGTHIVGQAGFGPGIRKRITEVQIELHLEHNALDEALRTKEPVIVRKNDKLECSGLNLIMKKLNLGSFAIVPLVSLGQPIGVLVVEPSVDTGFFTPAKMTLLRNMANEIATVLMAKRFESKMSEAGKMRMAGLFASGVAHNFNNLLQAVMGQASLLEMQLDKKSPQFSSVKMINEAARKGANLVRQLLTFSQQSKEEREDISMNDLVNESLELYRSILGSSIRLELDLSSKLPAVNVDSGQLQQVISNMLFNAKDALREKGGIVRVSTTRVRLKSGEIDPELPPGEYVRVNVEDNGSGMNEEACSRCFEPFYTTKNVDSVTGIGVSGSGLGLSSAYSIVKGHDGLITVQSKPGLGSTFSIYLPVIELEDSDRSKAFSAEIACAGIDRRSLAACRATFDSLGCHCAQFASKEDLLEAVQANQKLRMILLDTDYEGEGTEELLKSIRAIRPKLAVLIATDDYAHWSSLLSSYGDLHLLEKPLGVWVLHDIGQSIFGEGLASNGSKRVFRSSANGLQEQPAKSKGSRI